MDQIKNDIISGELAENEALPSVRSLAGNLKISALTVKKAYDRLEEEGFVVTVHGKGTYVAPTNRALAFLPIFMLIIAIMIPVELKYGAERSRVVLALAGGAAMLIGFGAGKLFELETPAFVLKLQQISDSTAIAALIIAALLLTAVSLLCSLHIMENKEFLQDILCLWPLPSQAEAFS